MRVLTLVLALVVLAAPSPAASQQTSNPPQEAQENQSEFLTKEERYAIFCIAPLDAALKVAALDYDTYELDLPELTGNTQIRRDLLAAQKCLEERMLSHSPELERDLALAFYTIVGMEWRRSMAYAAGLERENAQLRYALAVQTAALRGGQQYASPNIELQGIERALRNVDTTLQWMESQRRTEKNRQDSQEWFDSYLNQQTQPWQGFDLDSSQRREEERRRRLLDDVKQQLRDQQLVDELLRRLWLLSPDY